MADDIYSQDEKVPPQVVGWGICQTGERTNLHTNVMHQSRNEWRLYAKFKGTMTLIASEPQPCVTISR